MGKLGRDLYRLLIGAVANIGFNSGVVKCVQDKAREEKWTHCYLQRQALASKKNVEELHDTLNAVKKCVNYVKARPLNLICAMFSYLCNEMGSDYIGLLLHSEARWLSNGQVLQRIFKE